MCVSSACLCPSTICLPARSRAAACCSSLSVDVPSPLQAPVDSWSTRLLLQFSCCFFQPALPLPARLRHCLALPGFVGSHLPRQRIHSLTTAFRPALPHPASQSVSRQSVAPRLTVSCSLDQAATSATTSPESSARAGPDISYLLAVASSACSPPPPPPVTSSTSPHLRQSRLHHPATPPPTTTRQPLTNPSPVDDLFT